MRSDRSETVELGSTVEPTRSGLLARQPDVVLGRLTTMVASMVSAPVVMFTLREEDLTVFEGALGLPPALASGPPVPMRDSMCQFVILDGEEMIVPDVAAHSVLSTLPPARLVGAAAYAGVPVRAADGRTIGSLCVIDHVVREWTPAEIDMFRSVAIAAGSELALRVALRRSESAAREAEAQTRRAETHAEQAAELARVLQEALLPSVMPQMPGLELATRYRAGASGADVLGDFYDVFPTPTGWGIVVGDVCGKGIHAARTTALARSTVRAVGHTEDDAETVLATLNEVLHVWFAEQDRSFATAVYATLHHDDDGVAVTVASGGHPAGFVLGADGRVQQLLDGGRVLGLYPESHVAVEKVRLGDGDSLVLFTDGITEARPPGRTEQFEEEGVDRVLRGLEVGCDAERIADAVSDAALAHAGGRVPDDTAVLVVRRPPGGARG